MKPALSVPDTLALLRAKHPEGLICTKCARSLATKKESYAKSNLTESARLIYVCSECRMDARMAALAFERLKKTRPQHRDKAAERTRRWRKTAKPKTGSDEALVTLPQGDTYASREGVSNSVSVKEKQRVIDMTARRRGRPRLHRDRKTAQAAASAAYRARKRVAA